MTAFLKLAERFSLSHFAYAHRGLWLPNGPSENSLEALLAAAEAGLGVEFDVRPTRDGRAVIFHDPDISRMIGGEGLVEALSYDELKQMKLACGEAIITLDVLLAEWSHETPLLCEIKIDGQTDPVEFTEHVSAMLGVYPGPAAIMSFSRQAVAAIPDDVPKAQLLYPADKIGGEAFDHALGVATRNRALNYICCHTSDVERLQAWRAETGLPLATYTVGDIATSQRLKPLVDAQIFEGFDPDLVKPDAALTSLL